MPNASAEMWVRAGTPGKLRPNAGAAGEFRSAAEGYNQYLDPCGRGALGLLRLEPDEVRCATADFICRGLDAPRA